MEDDIRGYTIEHILQNMLYTRRCWKTMTTEEDKLKSQKQFHQYATEFVRRYETWLKLDQEGS